MVTVTKRNDRGASLGRTDIKNGFVHVGNKTYKLGEFFPYRRQVQLVGMIDGLVHRVCTYEEDWPADCVRRQGVETFQFLSRKPTWK